MQPLSTGRSVPRAACRLPGGVAFGWVPVAQWTEQPPSKRSVAGSNPAGDAMAHARVAPRAGRARVGMERAVPSVGAGAPGAPRCSRHVFEETCPGIDTGAVAGPAALRAGGREVQQASTAPASNRSPSPQPSRGQGSSGRNRRFGRRLAPARAAGACAAERPRPAPSRRRWPWRRAQGDLEWRACADPGAARPRADADDPCVWLAAARQCRGDRRVRDRLIGLPDERPSTANR